MAWAKSYLLATFPSKNVSATSSSFLVPNALTEVADIPNILASGLALIIISNLLVHSGAPI